MYHIRQVCCNVGIRREWETILYDIQAFDVAGDMNYMKTYYTYRSPRIGPIGVADRDFLLSQDLVLDYPEKGMMTVYFKSIEDDRMPAMKGKVRATAHIQAFVCKPDQDPDTGKDVTHVMLVTNIDINGLVPKWIVNIAARSAPAQWFVDCQRACDMFVEGKFKIKPSDVIDWRTGPMLI